MSAGTPERFGDYELVRYLAAGGMADLYLARSARFPGRDCVVKRIQPRYLDHTRVVKMFIDEGRIATLLDHPNIVRVIDVGSEAGAWYIAMEYIHGHDLVALGRRSVESKVPIPRGVAVGVVTQVAAGLSYAHTLADEQGRPFRIVHCDVSPGNVVISFRGLAKVVDFGIARATIALREEDGVAGKYNYMAPEQVRGDRVDARADLFSLGVILWELTSGRRLFKGRPEVILKKVMDDPIPSPLELVPGYPRALERIVMRLLQRDPAARFPSAAALMAELKDYLAREEVGYGKGEIARYLQTLFRAPRADGTDPQVIVEDVEVDRGMPETGEVPLQPVDEGGELLDEDLIEPIIQPIGQPIAPTVSPRPPSLSSRPTMPIRPPSTTSNDAPTAAIQLPPRLSHIEPTKKVRVPAEVDPTMVVRLPKKKGKGGLQLTTPIVVGGCVALVVVLLLVVYFTAAR